MQNYYKGNFFFFTKEKHFTCTKSLDTGLIPPKKNKLFNRSPETAFACLPRFVAQHSLSRLLKGGIFSSQK